MRARWLPLLALGVAAACGGRTSSTLSNNGDEASSDGGSANAKQKEPDTSTAATASATGQGGSGPATVGMASGSAGRAGVAGASASGGSGAGGSASSCSCDADIVCEIGYVVSREPERCCRCVVDCPSVGCVDLECPAGTHSVQEDDECCPSCIPDQPLSCEEAQLKYDELRTALVAQFRDEACHDDVDCSQFWEDNRCHVTCGSAIPSVGVEMLEDVLQDFAADNCGNCPRQKAIPCARPFPARCVDGHCQ